MGKVKSVLFVCTGNSCRSIMAEGLLKKYLKEFGKTDIEVSSAGVRVIPGMLPTQETVEVTKAEGIDLSSSKSKNLTSEMIKKADLILVMESMHRIEILRRVPEAANKTFLLKEFANPEGVSPSEGIEVPDPIGRPVKDYKMSFEMIKKEIKRIAELL